MTTLVDRMAFYAKMIQSDAFTRGALCVAFVLLYRCMNGNTGRCDPSIPTIARQTGMPTRSVERAIKELKKSGWWRINREGTPGLGGRTNAYAPRFEASERPDKIFGTSEAKGPPKMSGLQGERPDKVGRKVPTRASGKPGRNQESESLVAGARASARGAFETFWRIYPSRGEHPNPEEPAAQKFQKALKDGVDPTEIIAGAERYRAYVEREGKDPRYVAQATTWLTQQRWNERHEPKPHRARVGVL